MKTCKDCKIEKPLSEFYKYTKKNCYRGRCKKCHQLRFYKPKYGKPGFKKCHTPWNKGNRGNGACRASYKSKEWIKSILKRDNYMCTECSSFENLVAHHIKSWNKFSMLRFDFNNGITLCHSCHSKLHRTMNGFQKGRIPWNKGGKWNNEVKEKISKKLKGNKSKGKLFKKGHVPWNKGLKLGDNDGNKKFYK